MPNRSPVSIVAFLLVAGALGFGLGYVFGGRKGVTAGGGGSAPETLDAAGAVRSFGELTLRNRGTFVDPLEYAGVQEKMRAARASILVFGPRAYDAVIEFLGVPAPSRAGVTPATPRAVEQDPEVRSALLALLPDLNRAAAGPELARRLHDSNEPDQARVAAAAGLARCERDVAVPALTKALDACAQRPWAGARSLVEALEAHPGPDTSTCLLRTFQRGGTDMSLRIAVCEALGNLKVAEAADALETMIRFEESDHYVRRAAVVSMLKIDEARADRVALEQLTRERDGAFQAWLKSFVAGRGPAPR